MQFEIINGEFVGTAEWRGPGQVALDMDDGAKEAWFTRYFEAEESVMTGPVDCAGMSSERRDSSREAFQRAAFQLAGYAYKVRAKRAGERTTADGSSAREEA